MKKYSIRIKRICIAWATIMATCNIWAGTHPIDSVLYKVSRNNIALQALVKNSEADIAAMKATNSLGATSIDYSPFYAKEVKGVASSEFIVKQDFDFPTLYAARSQATKASTKTKEWEYKSMRQEILLNALQLCLDLVHMNKQITLMTERYNAALSLSALYEKKMEQGATTILEMNRIKMEMMQTAARIEQLKAEQKTLEHSLQALNGDKPIELDCTSYPQWSEFYADTAFFANYMAHDATLKRMETQTEVSKRHIAVSRQEKLPKLSVGYRRNTSMENASNGFLVGAAIPLFTGKQKIKEAKARHEGMKLQLEDTQVQTLNELKKISYNAASTKRTMNAYNLNVIIEAKNALDKAIKNGSITAVEYFRESDNINESLSEYMKVENKYYKLLAEMQKFTL